MISSPTAVNAATAITAVPMPGSSSPAWAPPELDMMAVTTAIITAPPTWMKVLSSPEANPCSSSETPAVACELTAGNNTANPIPSSTMVGNMKFQ
ncbi:hypothetical protein QF027_007669 [Streptomyces canus]|nr:hypothetical protein [Streptomyces canus]MDQ0765034.1 hypothetical protein [Streptomyces canus]